HIHCLEGTSLPSPVNVPHSVPAPSRHLAGIAVGQTRAIPSGYIRAIEVAMALEILRAMTPLDGTTLEYGDLILVFDGHPPRILRTVDIDYGRLGMGLETGKLVQVRRDAAAVVSLAERIAAGDLSHPPAPPQPPAPPAQPGRSHLTFLP